MQWIRLDFNFCAFISADTNTKSAVTTSTDRTAVIATTTAVTTTVLQ